MTTPCPYDCIVARNERTGKLYLYGDCRVPWSDECWLNRKDKEKEDEEARDQGRRGR